MRITPVRPKSSRLIDTDTGLDLATTRILHPYEYWYQSRQSGTDHFAHIAFDASAEYPTGEERRGDLICNSDSLWYRMANRFTIAMLALRVLFRS